MDLLSLFSFRKTEPYQKLNQNQPTSKAYKDLIERLSDLKRINAREIMTPRALVEAVDADVEIQRLSFPNSSHPYFPVYQGDLDHILGWIGHETLKHLIHNGHSGNLRTEYVPADVIPEDFPLDLAFLKFVQSSVPLFVVQNSAGHTTGVLYLSDVLEVFFGLDMEPTLNPSPIGEGLQTAHG